MSSINHQGERRKRRGASMYTSIALCGKIQEENREWSVSSLRSRDRVQIPKRISTWMGRRPEADGTLFRICTLLGIRELYNIYYLDTWRDTFAVLIGYRLRAPPAGDRYEELKRYPSRSPSAGFTGCAFGSISYHIRSRRR